MSKIVNFSVVIPVYNVGEVLRKCLDSLLNQPFNDYEIILVNDGSTDCKTIEICEEYGKSKSIIRLFNKPNGGCIDARRYGTLQSKGKYITYGDGDDFFAEDYIQILHDAVRHPADLYIFNNFCFLFRHVPLSLPEFRQFAVLTLLPPQDYLAESSNFHPDGAPNQKEKLHPPVVH